MKKKLLVKMAFVAMFFLAFASCTKDDVVAYSLKDESNDVEFNVEMNSDESGNRADQWTAEKEIALSIIANLPNGWIYDTDALFNLGLVGGHYVVCVPSSMFPSYFLIVFPREDIAFSIHEKASYTSFKDILDDVLRPYYEFEICNEGGPGGFVLCDGRFYPYIGTTTSFVITHKYPSTEIWDMNYNLTQFYSSLSVGIFPYYGVYQGNSDMTLNDYLYSIVLNSYINFID